MNNAKKLLSMGFVSLLIATAFSIVVYFGNENAEAHVTDSSGNPLQLYSFFTQKTPKINGDITDSTTNAGVTPISGSDPTEWDGAYVRKSSIKSSTDGTERIVYILLMNDDQYLYIAILIDQTNSGTGKWVQLYFDEGNGPSTLDGSHDDVLTSNNEDSLRSTHQNNLPNTLTDMFWNGTAWENEASASFSSQSWKAGQYFTYEFAIPLNNINTDGAAGSDLDVLSTDEIGFNFKFYETTGTTGVMDWTLTSTNVNSASGWADIKLGLEKSERDLYATYSTMTPTIDGDISNDFAWADTFIKKLKFTDFKGNTTDGTIFLSENPSSNRINFGLSIYHSTYNTGDYLRIYQERKAMGGPRDVLLNDNEENMIQVNGDGSYLDRYYIKNLNQPTWTNNDIDGDSSALGDARFYNFAGNENDRYEFEISFYYNKGLYDCQFTSGNEIGFLIEFYDADTSSSYWWEATTNVNAVQYQNDGTSVALGWATLQTSSPWLRLITPADGGTVEGNTFLVQVQADDPNGINFVGYKVVGDLAYSSLTKVDALTYEGTWDTTTRVNGIYEMIFVAQDTNNTIVKKKISVTIANPISSSPPSGVSITSAPITSGLGIVQATATSAARVELLVDNVYVSDMVWNDATERYETLLNTLNYNDGTHQLRVRAINPVGESSAYQFITLDNWDDLTDTRIVKPSAGEAVNHSYNVLSNFMGRDKAWAMFNSSIPYPGFCEIYVDGMLTAVQYEESEIIPGEEFGYSLTINTVWFDDGQHTLKSVVYGPEGTSLFDIILFNIVNKPTLQILSPASGEVISGSNYELSLMAEDPNGDAIVSAQYRIDGGPWFAMSYSGTSSIYVATLDTTLISDGYHTIQFQVTDECSSVSVSQVTVNVDNVVLSSVSITSPSIGETISNFYPVKAHAEPASQCKYAELYVDEIYCGFDNTLDINGDFEFNLSTIGFSDGLHSIKVIVYDPYGNLVVDTKTITFSNMPTIMLISPTNGSVIGGTSHLEILTTDNDGISTAQFRIDTGTWIDMMLTGGPVTYVASYNLNTLQVSNGTHNLEFRVIDGGGFPDIASYINLEITIDNVLPTMCEIVSPLQNEYISGQYTFQIKAVDNLGISMVGVSLSGIGTFYPTYNSVTGFYEITRNTLPYPDGTYTASAFVKDYAGNTYSSSAVTFYIDNNAPVLNVQSPVEGAILSGAVMIETNVLDTFVHSVEYNVDGSGWVEITTTWNTLGVADGHHTVTIRALDNLLHETRTSVNVIVDNNNPQCGIISPVNNQFIEGILTVRVIAQDNVGIANVTVDILGMKAFATYSSQSGCYEYSVDTRVWLVDMQTTINVTATDISGKSALSSVTINVDNNAPSLSLNSPMNGAFVSGSISINTNAVDEFLKSIEYNVDGMPWVSISEGLDTTTLSDGIHTIQIRAQDLAGHVTVRSVQVTVDNNAPRVIVVSPRESATIGGTVIVKVDVREYVSIAKVRIGIDSTNPEFMEDMYVEGKFYEYEIDTKKLTDGIHRLTIYAEDNCGHNTSVNIRINVDNTGPTIVIKSPDRDRKTVSGKVILEVESTDVSNVSKVYISIDTGVWTEMLYDPTSNSYMYIWYTTEKDNGLHRVDFKAVDKLGSESTARREVRVENPKEVDYLANLMSVLPLIVFLFAIGFLALLFVLMRYGILQKWVKGEPAFGNKNKGMDVKADRRNEVVQTPMIKGETTKTEPMENMDMRNEQNVTQNDTNQGNVKPSVSLSGISAESQIPSSDTEKTTVENTPKN